jgi:hypothetical protein
VLISRGMPAFPELDASQLVAIHAYIRAKARQALVPQ